MLLSLEILAFAFLHQPMWQQKKEKILSPATCELLGIIFVERDMSGSNYFCSPFARLAGSSHLCFTSGKCVFVRCSATKPGLQNLFLQNQEAVARSHSMLWSSLQPRRCPCGGDSFILLLLRVYFQHYDFRYPWISGHCWTFCSLLYIVFLGFITCQ